MHANDKFSLELSEEEGILLLTSARLLDKLVAGVTIYARERDELIKQIIDKLSGVVSPELSVMSDELAEAIVESVVGCDEMDDMDCDCDVMEMTRINERSSEPSVLNYPMYSTDRTLPVLERALVTQNVVYVE